MTMTERIFVTGANGFIGANLVKKLVEDKNEVVALVKNGEITHPLLRGLEFEVSAGDVLNSNSVEKAMKGCTQAYNLAARVSFNEKDLRDLLDVNVGGAVNVANSALKKGIRLVHTSACAVFGYSKNPHQIIDENNVIEIPKNSVYAYTKKRAEEEIREMIPKGLDATFVNPATTYGAGDQKLNSGGIIKKISSGKAFIAPPGGTSTISVRDVVTGHIKAMEKGKVGENYILSSELMSYLKLFERIARIVKVTPPRMKVPSFTYPFAYVFIYGYCSLSGLLGKPSEFVTPQILKETYGYKYYSNQKAISQIDWTPENSFEDAVGEALDYYQKNNLL